MIFCLVSPKSLPKEKIEVFGAHKVAVINDFQNGNIHAGNKTKNIKVSGKGHPQEVQVFLTALKEGNDSPISFHSIYLTTLTTFKIIDSLKTGLPQVISTNA